MKKMLNNQENIDFMKKKTLHYFKAKFRTRSTDTGSAGKFNNAKYKTEKE